MQVTISNQPHNISVHVEPIVYPKKKKKKILSSFPYSHVLPKPSSAKYKRRYSDKKKCLDLYNENQHCMNKLLKHSSEFFCISQKKESHPSLEEMEMSDRLHFWANYSFK